MNVTSLKMFNGKETQISSHLTKNQNVNESDVLSSNMKMYGFIQIFDHLF